MTSVNCHRPLPELQSHELMEQPKLMAPRTQHFPAATNTIETSIPDYRQRALTPAQEALAQERLSKFEAGFHKKFKEGKEVQGIAKWNAAAKYKLQEIRNKILDDAEENRKMKESSHQMDHQDSASSYEPKSSTSTTKLGSFWKKKLGINTSPKSPHSKEIIFSSRSKK